MSHDAPRAESVEALLSVAQRVADEERARGATLTTKTSTLAGFSGTILAIVSALGRELFARPLGSPADDLIPILFIVSVVALATAGALAIRGVLRTQPRLTIDTDQLRAFAAPPWTSTNPIEINGNMLASIARSVGQDRALNDRKARLADQAALALLIGLLAVAAQALCLGINEVFD